MATILPLRRLGFAVPVSRWMLFFGLAAVLTLLLHTYLYLPITPPSFLPLADLPLAFVPNRGQNDPAVQYQVQNGHGRVEFLANGVNVAEALAETAVAWGYRFVGANEEVEIAAANLLPGKVNYLLGSDPAHWQTNLPAYATLQYPNLYPGIDVQFLGRPEALSALIVVVPGGEVSTVRWHYDTNIQLDAAAGQINLLFNTPGQSPITTTALLAPLAWQTINGEQKDIPVQYQLEPDQSITLSVESYNPTQPLFVVTQAPLEWLGSDSITGLAVDDTGYAYVVGITDSPTFPVLNGTQMSSGGDSDSFVTKFNLDGTGLIYSTYLGGSYYEQGSAISVDDTGQVMLTGVTYSNDFPVVTPLQAVYAGGGDAFVTKLSADGSAIIYSTYLGGSGVEWDWAYDIVHDTVGNVYVAGVTSSVDFPVMNPFQAILNGDNDGFVSKIASGGNDLVYSTYLGGSGFEAVTGITLNDLGQVYATGATHSRDFPVLNPIQPASAGNYDAFITHFSVNGNALEYSSYLGGSGNDTAYAVDIGQLGDIYLAGYTESADFPIMNPWQAILGGSYDFFVTRLMANGTTFAYSTYLGGLWAEIDPDIVVDGDGTLYLTGSSDSVNYPVLNAVQPTLAGLSDTVVTGLTSDGGALIYSTYYGGSEGDLAANVALDGAGNVYVAGETVSADFPTTAGAWQEVYAELGDGFLFKLTPGGTVAYSTYHGSSYPGPTDVTLTSLDGSPERSWWPFVLTVILFLLARGLLVRLGQKG